MNRHMIAQGAADRLKQYERKQGSERVRKKICERQKEGNEGRKIDEEEYKHKREIP